MLMPSSSPSASLKPKRSPRGSAQAGTENVDALLETAQRLFAERGIDAVSMREISREAGHRNNSALQYHFGTKEALLQAILDAGMREVNVLRNDHIDRLFATRRHTELRALVEALVWPLAAKLQTKKRNTYNRFLAASQIHPDINLRPSPGDTDRGFRRLYELVESALPQIPASVMQQRWLASISFMLFALADYERISARRSKSERAFDIQRAIENLIDMLTGALAAPVSEQVLQRSAAAAEAAPEESGT